MITEKDLTPREIMIKEHYEFYTKGRMAAKEGIVNVSPTWGFYQCKVYKYGYNDFNKELAEKKKREENERLKSAFKQPKLQGVK